jgi:hypothetical protein
MYVGRQNTTAKQTATVFHARSDRRHFQVRGQPRFTTNIVSDILGQIRHCDNVDSHGGEHMARVSSVPRRDL